MSRALILEGFEDVDVLSQPPTVEVCGRNLRAGMVLVDPDLGTPAVGLDHKVQAPRNSGSVAFLCADLEKGGWVTHTFFGNSKFSVVAKDS